MTVDGEHPKTLLDMPLPGASLPEAVGRFWRKYATFSGRASRSEFWFASLALVVTVFIGAVIVPAPLVLLPDGAYRAASFALVIAVDLYLAAVIVPLLAVTWRRLHDVNSSGGLFFFGLIPVIGPIMLLINLAGPSDPDGARFDAATPPAPSVPSADATVHSAV